MVSAATWEGKGKTHLFVNQLEDRTVAILQPEQLLSSGFKTLEIDFFK